MNRLNPNKLNVEYRNVDLTVPVRGRKYTQTHSDVTAELFVTIGLQYAYDKINPMRDEVLAEWRCNDNNQCHLWAYVCVGNFGPAQSRIRYDIFRRELPLALAAIRNGDSNFFKAHPGLDKASIYVYFDSPYSALSGYKYYGIPSNYRDYYRQHGG